MGLHKEVCGLFFDCAVSSLAFDGLGWEMEEDINLHCTLGSDFGLGGGPAHGLYLWRNYQVLMVYRSGVVF